MVTMHNWMFLRSFAEFRLSQKNEHQVSYNKGIIHDTTIELIAHLGPRAFDPDNKFHDGVAVVMFALSNIKPQDSHKIIAYRLVGLRNPKDKERTLKQQRNKAIVYYIHQKNFSSLLEAPIVYWLREQFFALLDSSYRLKNIADVRQGLATTDNNRFLRYGWEARQEGVIKQNRYISGRWFWYVKGGRYQKWSGVEWTLVDWRYNGSPIKAFVITLPNTTHWSRRVANENYYFQQGLTYTLMAGGSFATRVLRDAIFDVSGLSIFPKHDISYQCLASLITNRTTSYLLRVTTQSLKFQAGYVANLPLPANPPLNLLNCIGTQCIALKNKLVSQDPIERYFETVFEAQTDLVETILHTLEGWNEKR